MAVQEAAAPGGMRAWRGIASVAAAAVVVVGFGAIGLASIPGAAGQEHGVLSRADRAWATRLEAVAAMQAEVAIARQRADTAYSDRLTAQAGAFAASQVARERANAAYSERLTRLAERLATQGR
ncbi:MAG TPA: hypothetical protein VFU44_02185 [Candidatus Limnocylindria bacterium]|nr:hypothetical protein [Candidatus Limnocylindria bacterium]